MTMLYPGNKFSDERGVITFNNDFDASSARRLYTIENRSVDFIRGWQGHKIEQRWFAPVKGAFRVWVIKIDDWESPSKDLAIEKYDLSADTLNFLHIPAGCVTAIRAVEEESKLLVLADYLLGETQDEYRFPLDYFKL